MPGILRIYKQALSNTDAPRQRATGGQCQQEGGPAAQEDRQPGYGRQDIEQHAVQGLARRHRTDGDGGDQSAHFAQQRGGGLHLKKGLRRDGEECGTGEAQPHAEQERAIGDQGRDRKDQGNGDGEQEQCVAQEIAVGGLETDLPHRGGGEKAAQDGAQAQGRLGQP